MLTRTLPVKAGLSPARLLTFLKKIEESKLHIHSFMFLRHDDIFLEGSYSPYCLDAKHMFFSMSKSFTSTAIGFAVQEGLLSVQDHVLDFFPEESPANPSEYFKQLTIRDLLTMRSGHLEEQLDILKRDHWCKDFLETKLDKQPGTHFAYNTVGTYMLSAIVQKLTGQTMLEYLRPRLLDPLGISHDLEWETSPEGITAGGFGIAARLEDITRFCMFVLHKGRWNGEQLLNREWFEDATRVHADNSFASHLKDWQQGYGYQFWHCTPAHVFRGDGAFGQLGLVFPEQDMVIAFHAGCADDDEIQLLLDLLWQYVLPFVDEKLDMENDMPAQEALEKHLSEIMLPTYFSASEPFHLQTDVIYKLNDGLYGAQTMQFEKKQTGYEVVLKKDGQAARLPLCANQWACCEIPWLKKPINPQCKSFSSLVYSHEVAIKAGMAQGELFIDFAFLGTPFQDSWKMRFSDQGVWCTMQRPASFFPANLEQTGYIG